MKASNLILVFVLTSLTTFSQELKYDDLFSEKKPKGPFKSYVSKDGTIYKVGEKIKIGVPADTYNAFSYIWVGDGLIVPEKQLGISDSNTETKIMRIVIGGSKKSGFKALFRTRVAEGKVLAYTIIVEKALQSGEIKRSGLTRVEAFTELREAKGKLDSGLISQHQYDSIKVVMTKYIK
jgi:hypothetical protein